MTEKQEERAWWVRLLQYSPSPTARMRLALLALPLALEVLAFKLIKYAQVVRGASLGGLYHLLRWDLLFLLFFVLLLLLLNDGLQGWRRKATLVLFHLFALACMELAVVEHKFFVSTGTVGDWYMLKYTLSQFSELTAVMASKTDWSARLLLLLPFPFVLAPLWLPLFSSYRRWVTSQKKAPRDNSALRERESAEEEVREGKSSEEEAEEGESTEEGTEEGESTEEGTEERENTEEESSQENTVVEEEPSPKSVTAEGESSQENTTVEERLPTREQEEEGGETLCSEETGGVWSLFRQRRRWGLGLVVLVLVLVVPPRRSLPGAAQPLGPNVYLHIGLGIWRDLFQREVPFVYQSSAKQLFDTHNLRFVATPRTRRMNVVFIILESFRTRSVTPYNPKMPTTPFLQKLSRRAVMVDRMYTVLPHTSKALIAPLCGIYPKVTIKITEGLINGIPGRCLPELLKPHGYRSAFFQPATLNFEGRAQLIENMGFDIIRGHEDFERRGFDKTNYFGYEDMIMFKPSLRWLDKVLASKEPFFLTYLTLVSHHTYTTPRWFKKRRYTRSKDPELNSYLNSLRYIDDFVARLFVEFKRRKMLDNTIFFLFGDHGEAFSEHGRRQHDNIMWEEGLRAPAFIYSPRLFPRARRIKGMRQHIDLLPTVADLLGFRLAGGRIPGRSLFQPVPAQRQLFFACWYEKQCLATLRGPVKYIYHYNRMPTEVYHILKDPLEKKNLAGSPDARYNGKRIKQMIKQMLQWKYQIKELYESSDRQRRERAVSQKMPQVRQRIDARFGEYIRLVGFNLHTPVVSPGGTVDITYVFQALRPIPRHIRLFFHLHLRRPSRFVNVDHVPVGGAYPEHRWKKGQFVQDRQRIRIPANFPKDRLQLFLGAWSKKSRKRLDIKGQHLRLDKKKRLLLVEIPLR